MIRINALGGLSVRDAEGKPVSGATAQPRRMAILAVLARTGQRGVTREKLLALLWPDADGERGPRTLAQALYALRKDLGAEGAIAGAKELRLDPEYVSSDAGEFASAVSRGEDERAVSLYSGPFLDGFHLPGAEEFSRWAERERAALAGDYARALESLARAARTSNEYGKAIGWWRKLAAIEPLNARVTVGLMDALAAAGDRAGALQHARVYELLLEQELDLPPDAEVLAFAERIRRSADTTAISVAPAPVSVAVPVQSSSTAVQETRAPSVTSSVASPIVEQLAAQPAVPTYAPPARVLPVGGARPRYRAALVAGLATVAVAVIAWLMLRDRGAHDATAAGAASGPVVAIGNIESFGSDSAPAALTAPVADLLTTSLARVRTIRVVSHGRMLELLRASGTASDTNAGGLVNAARQAGATELIDGTLYTRPGSQLRLDLRRVDLTTGAIGDVYTVEGHDLFALVDSGTARLVSSLGIAAPAGSVADVTTRSVTAYRMYEQGIRAYYRGEIASARNFFDAALAEDSLFALAAYYSALSTADPTVYLNRMEQAKRLATRATDRERLVILAGWANTVSSPTLGAIAETLVTRYPAEVYGHLYSGMARVLDGDFLGALSPLQRAVAMDSLGLRGERPRCSACDAMQWIVGAYLSIDSLPAAEREARRSLRLQPRSGQAASTLVSVLELEGKAAEADSIFQATAPRGRSYSETVDYRALHLLRIGAYAEVDRILLAQLHESNPQQQVNALWNLTISLREQGRLTEALDAARRMRHPLSQTGALAPGMVPINVLEAQVLLEMGRFAQSATLFDSLAHQRNPAEAPSQRARGTVWMLAQSIGARFAAGDTASFVRMADSVRILGEQSSFGRDRRLYHYVLGLLFSARGDDAHAIDELREAMFALTNGFTRTNLELARVYLRAHRAREAVSILQPALRGSLDASNLYVSRTELHEMLARAWEDVGSPDSAAAHYAWVAKAWASADPFLVPRRNAAQARLVALGH